MHLHQLSADVTWQGVVRSTGGRDPTNGEGEIEKDGWN